MNYTKKSDQATVKQELEDTSPAVVRFYKKTCPACQMSASAWDALRVPGYRVIAVEEQAIPPEVLTNLSAFPTYAVHDKKGNRHVTGAITETALIKEKLGLARI